eukprot:4471626-Prorocentrum_lima.AAC.1
MNISTWGEQGRPWWANVVTIQEQTSRMVGIDSKGRSQVGRHIQAWRSLAHSTSSIKARMPVES